MGKIKKATRKIFKAVAYLLFLIFTIILLLELSYRTYLFDFYASNFNLLNKTELAQRDNDRSRILVMGDSFTADLNSYVRYLRDSLPDYQIFNAAIPGTCIKQSNLMADKRIKQVQPDILIYQIYIGNDFFEFKHHTREANISSIRKWYWWLSDRIWVLAYINSRLPYIRQAISNDHLSYYDPNDLGEYTPEKYSSRSKLQFRTEPDYLEQTILLKGKREKDVKNYTKMLNSFLSKVPQECKIYVLIIPHCAQISEKYKTRMEKIGAKFDESAAINSNDYPLYDYIKAQIGHREVSLINAIPILRAAELEKPTFYGNDPHLNLYGQSQIGIYLTNILKE